MRPNTSRTFWILSHFLSLFFVAEKLERKQGLWTVNFCENWEGIMGIINNNNIKINREIEKVNGKELNYSEFVERYMVKNKPVVLTGLMDHHWRACTDWVTPDGKPNLQFFFNHFGSSKVQVPKFLLLN